MRKIIGCIFLLCLIFNGGCVSTIVGTAADIAIGVVKVPFKAGAAIAGAFSSDHKEGNTDKEKDTKKE